MGVVDGAIGLLYREVIPFCSVFCSVFCMNPIEILFYLVVFGLLAVSVYCWFYRNLETFQLKCIVSTVDGEKYCVRERDRVQEAADLLARVTDKCKNLVDYMGSNYSDDARVQQLVERFNPKTIMETLPTSC